MARITVEDCLKKVDNQYDLVLLAKERTSQLNSGSEMLVKELKCDETKIRVFDEDPMPQLQFAQSGFDFQTRSDADLAVSGISSVDEVQSATSSCCGRRNA